MSLPRHALRLAAVGVLVLAISVGLTGCLFPAPTDRSYTGHEDAQRQIESIPGVERATINALAGDATYSSPTATPDETATASATTGSDGAPLSCIGVSSANAWCPTPGSDGVTHSYGIFITVAVSDGYHVGDADAAMVWIVQEAWAAASQRPDSIDIRFEASSAKPYDKQLDWGWKDAITKRGWNAPFVGISASDYDIMLSDSPMTSLTGESWPGPVPETPPNLFVKN